MELPKNLMQVKISPKRMKITPKLTGCTLIKHKNKKHAKHALKILMPYLTKAPVTLSTFIHKVIFFTGHLVVAPGK